MAHVRTGDLWTFTVAPLTAFAPSPRNGDKWIDPNADLSWQPGMNASQRTLYFGTDQGTGGRTGCQRREGRHAVCDELRA